MQRHNTSKQSAAVVRNREKKSGERYEQTKRYQTAMIRRKTESKYRQKQSVPYLVILAGQTADFRNGEVRKWQATCRAIRSPR